LTIPKLGQFICSEAMLALHEETQDEGHRVFARLCDLGNQAHDLAFAPIEPGVHPQTLGHMRVMREGYFYAAQSMSLMFEGHNRGRDYFPYMVLRNRANNNPMPGWMQRLIDKNDGIVPLKWEQTDVSR
jgi:hypothetical protein